MTFSIAVRCERTRQMGVGALTAMIGVGKLVTHASAGIGAAATQATVNPYLAIDALERLAEGARAREVVDEITRQDPGRDFRQMGLVDRFGGSAAWTGPVTPSWSGQLLDSNVTVQGNRLVGPETLDATLSAFNDSRGQDLVERLMLALEAGEATGADFEGERSGVLLVVDSEAYPLWDVRVDEADDPARALRRLYGLMAAELYPEMLRLPTRADPLGEAARDQMG